MVDFKAHFQLIDSMSMENESTEIFLSIALTKFFAVFCFGSRATELNQKQFYFKEFQCMSKVSMFKILRPLQIKSQSVPKFLFRIINTFVNEAARNVRKM